MDYRLIAQLDEGLEVEFHLLEGVRLEEACEASDGWVVVSLERLELPQGGLERSALSHRLVLQVCQSSIKRWTATWTWK
jgi:hypothetical protein